MEKIDITEQFNAPLDKVFETVSDHANLANIPGVLSSKLIKPGIPDKNGKGAVRQIDGIGITMIEEIPAFEKNKFYEYRVVRCFFNLGFIQIDIPINHKFGKVSFVEKDGGTEVNWISIIDFDSPILSEIIAKILSISGGESFKMILKNLKNRVKFE